jgi:lipopolysaccharide transport system ATP-binding protein
MSDIVISVENLGKKYFIGCRQTESYSTLRDVIASAAMNLGSRLLRPFNSPAETPDGPLEQFWALNDVSVDVKQGEVVGIIGPNGAGKSTLLKILSRITEPTCGRVRIKGRVASLLEVGTGFHPELTGRENTFLNGAILGMSRLEIRRKFDEIVAFAEVEKFIDTPVKRYSSGMYVRLAFAVAAHLEPEIMLVDEVLAVGDTAFQNKCLGKMDRVAQQGRTVLYVSHNMASVRRLCSRVWVLSQGTVCYDGNPYSAISFYQDNLAREAVDGERRYRHYKGDGRVEITKIVINGAENGREAAASVFDETQISIEYVSHFEVGPVEFFVLIHSGDGEVQASLFQKDGGAYTMPTSKDGRVRLSFVNQLTPGKYTVSAGVFDRDRAFLDWVDRAESFRVEGTFSDGRAFDHRLGRVSLLGEWVDTK